MIFNIILLMMFRYYQPMCEPCIDNNDCPLCLSDEQYFIAYLGGSVNIIFVIYFLYKRLKRKK